MEYQRWLSKLLGFDFKIQYKPGLENKAADALSRRGVTADLMALFVPTAVQFKDVEEAVSRDPELQRICDAIAADPFFLFGFRIESGKATSEREDGDT